MCFANTGKEEEATLRFVQDCAEHWGVHISWVEYRSDAQGYALVDFATASRDGEPFEAIIDVELLPGDILYIPPGFPHDGVTLEESTSYSVGFRAKSGCDMLSGLADYVIDKELGKTLLTDPKRPIAHHQGQAGGSGEHLAKPCAAVNESTCNGKTNTPCMPKKTHESEASNESTDEFRFVHRSFPPS